MKKTFIKISLTLCALLLISVPAQAFAAEKPATNSKCNVATNQELQKQLQDITSKINLNCKDLLKNVTDGAVKNTNKTCNKTSNNGKNISLTKPSKPVAEKPVAEKPATTKPVAEKPVADKPATTKPVAEKPVAEKPVATKPATVAPSNDTSANVGAFEQQVANIVNKERAANGLPALKVNAKLSGVAEKKAEDMRDKNYFSHTSPTYGSPFDMMKQFGISYSSAGENIAKGQKTPEAVMTGWMNSPGHRANILSSNYTEIGIGYVTDGNGNTYWVQQFIRP